MCKFCKSFEDWNIENELLEKKNKDIETYMKVELICYSKRKNNQKLSSTIGCGIYEINYCPMCGRRLNEQRRDI